MNTAVTDTRQHKESASGRKRSLRWCLLGIRDELSMISSAFVDGIRGQAWRRCRSALVAKLAALPALVRDPQSFRLICEILISLLVLRLGRQPSMREPTRVYPIM